MKQYVDVLKEEKTKDGKVKIKTETLELKKDVKIDNFKYRIWEKVK